MKIISTSGVSWLKSRLFYRYAFVYSAWFGLVLFFMPRAGHFLDLPFWIRWATYTFEHGLGNIYQVRDNNYNPFYHYILYLFGLIAGSSQAIAAKIYWLKAITLLFDFGGALVAVSFVSSRKKQFALSFLLLLNIGYLYNTLIWGQVDSIYTFFSFVAVALALRGHPVGSALCYVLALNAKTQAIIFLPPLLLLLLPQWLQAGSTLLRSVVAGAGLQLLLLIPFIWLGEQNYVMRVLQINVNAVGLFDVLSMGAYNFWHLVFRGYADTVRHDDSYKFGLTYRVWGLLFFLGSSFLVLLPLFTSIVRNSINRQQVTALARSSIFLTCGLIPICFCYFNTEMHSRYWHAAILFLAAYSFVSGRYLLFGLCSVAYALNLEGVMRYLQNNQHIALAWNPETHHRFIAGLFTLVLLLGLAQLYRQTRVAHHLRALRKSLRVNQVQAL